MEGTGTLSVRVITSRAQLPVEGVQIFQGVETLQAMELEPLNEGQSSLIQNNVREMTGQTL